MSLYLGIDPGQGGGIAWTGPNGPAAEPMPETEREIVELLAPQAAAAVAVLEFVRSSPQMGVTSAFSFGRNYGALRMVLVALGIPFLEVPPPKWQGVMGCRSGGDKNVTKRRALELFPGLRITHKTADALLLAAYCARQDWRGIGR